MNLSALFIRRPGRDDAAHPRHRARRPRRLLPACRCRRCPQVDFPTISVQAKMPGASPETMATSVATPLERHLGTIADVTEMTSSSTVGQRRHHPAVRPRPRHRRRGARRAGGDQRRARRPAGRPAQQSDLPQGQSGRRADPDPGADLGHADAGARSTTPPITVLQQKLSQVEGVGEVTSAAARCRRCASSSIPTRSFKYGIGLEDVRAALAAANANSPKGAIELGRSHYQIYANDQATSAADYAPLVVAYRNERPSACPTSPTVTDAVEDMRNVGLANGKPAVLVIIYPAARRQHHRDRRSGEGGCCRELQASHPRQHRRHRSLIDRSTTIRASLADVERTLLIAVVLVVLVVFLFLRDPRAALIPSVAVPVSLIGTFGVHVSARLQPRQPVADGADHRDRLRRRRRDRRAREHHAPHRGGHAAASRRRCSARARSASPCCR